MTIKEAEYKIGVLTTTASVDDSISRLVRRIYNSDDDIYYKVLKTLNQRFDWFNIKPGAEIKYLPLNAISKISEV